MITLDTESIQVVVTESEDLLLLDDLLIPRLYTENQSEVFTEFIDFLLPEGI